MKDLIFIKNENLEVAVSPEIGASIYSMKYNKDGKCLDIMRPTSEQTLKEGNSGNFASFNLFPYSNRIENAILKFKGKEYQLEVNFADGHAIHGEARQRPWQIIKKDENKVLLEFNSNDFNNISWPFPFKAVLEYRLEKDSFIVKTSIKNEGNELMPAGMGIHPYFMRNISGKAEKVSLTMETIGLYPGETQIPTGHWVEPPEKWNFTGKRELTTDFLDNCFRAGQGNIEIDWEESDVRLTIERDGVFKHIIIYCPVGEEFFAVEPVTNCNNGFNMAAEGIDDTGIIELEAGEEVNGEIKFKLK